MGLPGQWRAEQAAQAGGDRARVGEPEAGHPEAPGARACGVSPVEGRRSARGGPAGSSSR